VQILRLLFCCVLLGFTATAGFAAATLPPKPAQWFNDYARLVSPQQADALNQRLEQFERDTSNQLVVAIYPQLPVNADAFDFTMRTAQSWGVGQKSRNNGAVLFIFVKDHAVEIRTGYGLEGALPDAVCHLIIENEIKPRFRAGDFAGGLDAATAAIIAATKGEYKGTGQTNGDASGNGGGIAVFWVFIFIIVLTSIFNRLRPARTTSIGRRGNDTGFWGGFGGGSGGGWSGGGGFSGGGGSFGGGGAGGKW